MGNFYRTENGQVPHCPPRQRVRRNRKYQLHLLRESEIVTPSVPLGPSHNPRYPRVCASPPSHRSSSPKRQAPRLALVLLLQARRSPLLLVFSGTEGRTVSLAAAERKRGCPRGSRAHRDRHRRSQDGLKQTISLMSKATRLVPRRTPTATNKLGRRPARIWRLLTIRVDVDLSHAVVYCCFAYAVTLITLDLYGDCMYYTTRIHRFAPGVDHPRRVQRLTNLLRIMAHGNLRRETIGVGLGLGTKIDKAAKQESSQRLRYLRHGST